MILDTSYIAALDGQDPDAQSLSRDHEQAGVPQRLPAGTLFELYLTVRPNASTFENSRKWEELVGNLPVVPVDGNIARRAGALEGVHQSSDSKPNLGVVDALNAATGLVLNEPVVTADTDDYGAVDGLEVVTWA